jgi:hypothetical protein
LITFGARIAIWLRHSNPDGFDEVICTEYFRRFEPSCLHKEANDIKKTPPGELWNLKNIFDDHNLNHLL